MIARTKSDEADVSSLSLQAKRLACGWLPIRESSSEFLSNINYTSTQLFSLETPLWFCLKAETKREHLAAATLRRQLGVQSFSPRLRFRRATKRGAVWFVEAMFPGYLFAQFVYAEQHRAVEYSPGISYIVRFGQQIATLDPVSIADLATQAGEDEIVTIDSEVSVGQEVRIVEGPLHGFEALVTKVLPARERVRVLLEFLGRSVETELSSPRVLSSAKPRPI